MNIQSSEVVDLKLLGKNLAVKLNVHIALVHGSLITNWFNLPTDAHKFNYYTKSSFICI